MIASLELLSLYAIHFHLLSSVFFSQIICIYLSFKTRQKSGTGDMAQQLRAVTILAKDWDSVPRPTHWPPTVCNYSSRESNTFFWFPKELQT